MLHNYFVKHQGLRQKIIFIVLILSVSIVPIMSRASSSKNQLHKVESLTTEKIKTIGISEALDILNILKHFPASEIYKGRVPHVQLSIKVIY